MGSLWWLTTRSLTEYHTNPSHVVWQTFRYALSWSWGFNLVVEQLPWIWSSKEDKITKRSKTKPKITAKVTEMLSPEHCMAICSLQGLPWFLHWPCEDARTSMTSSDSYASPGREPEPVGSSLLWEWENRISKMLWKFPKTTQWKNSCATDSKGFC